MEKKWFFLLLTLLSESLSVTTKSHFPTTSLFLHLIFFIFSWSSLNAVETSYAFLNQLAENIFTIVLSVLYCSYCPLKYADSKLSDTSEITLLFALNQNSNNTGVFLTFMITYSIVFCNKLIINFGMNFLPKSPHNTSYFWSTRVVFMASQKSLLKF